MPVFKVGYLRDFDFLLMVGLTLTYILLFFLQKRVKSFLWIKLLVSFVFFYCIYQVSLKLRSYKAGMNFNLTSVYYHRSNSNTAVLLISNRYFDSIFNANRKLVEQSKSYEEYMRSSGELIKEVAKKINLPSDELKTVAAFSILSSTMFPYGDPLYPTETGCLMQNRFNTFQPSDDDDFDFLLLKKSTVGCCNDYAYIMCKFLTYYKFENRVVLLAGHVLNEFKLQGAWHVIDANAGILAKKAFPENKYPLIYYIPHYGMIQSSYYRPTLVPFREFISTILSNPVLSKNYFYKYVPPGEYLPYKKGIKKMDSI